MKGSSSSTAAQRNNPTIGIIGGKGLLGSWFDNFLKSKGHSVLISDLNTPLTNQELVKRSEVIIFSVPIRDTVQVIESVISSVNQDQILIDLTSLKSPPITAMLKSSAEVLGLHPMFGPPIKSISGQTVIVCKSRPSRYTDWFLELLSSAGARLKESTPEEHDQMMAVVQGLNHLSTIALGSALHKLGVDVAESLTYSSPVYRMRMDLVARILAQDSQLYADIALENPMTKQVIEALSESLERIKANIIKSDRKDFLQQFNEASEQLGGFKKIGLSESDKLIEYLASISSD